MNKLINQIVCFIVVTLAGLLFLTTVNLSKTQGQPKNNNRHSPAKDSIYIQQVYGIDTLNLYCTCNRKEICDYPTKIELINGDETPQIVWTNADSTSIPKKCGILDIRYNAQSRNKKITVFYASNINYKGRYDITVFEYNRKGFEYKWIPLTHHLPINMMSRDLANVSFYPTNVVAARYALVHPRDMELPAITKIPVLYWIDEATGQLIEYQAVKVITGDSLNPYQPTIQGNPFTPAYLKNNGDEK